MLSVRVGMGNGKLVSCRAFNLRIYSCLLPLADHHDAFLEARQLSSSPIPPHLPDFPITGAMM